MMHRELKQSLHVSALIQFDLLTTQIKHCNALLMHCSLQNTFLCFVPQSDHSFDGLQSQYCAAMY